MINKNDIKLLVLLVRAAGVARELGWPYYAAQIWGLAGEYIDGLWARIAEGDSEYAVPEGNPGRVSTEQ